MSAFAAKADLLNPLPISLTDSKAGTGLVDSNDLTITQGLLEEIEAAPAQSSRLHEYSNAPSIHHEALEILRG